MRVSTCLCLAASVLALVPTSAMARQLAVAKVTPQNVACVFTTNCAVSATDSTTYFKLFGNSGYGKVLVRTYPGMPGTKAAGLTGYSIFIDMHSATSLGMANCVSRLTLDAGPVASLAYGGPAEVFTVSGTNGMGVSSVTQNGAKISFSFARPICPGKGNDGESLYFGFAAKNGPVPGKGVISGSLQGTADVDMRVPRHGGPNT